MQEEYGVAIFRPGQGDVQINSVGADVLELNTHCL